MIAPDGTDTRTRDSPGRLAAVAYRTLIVDGNAIAVSRPDRIDYSRKTVALAVR